MLISSQRAAAVLDQATAFGFHPEPYLRTRQLLVFEYPEDSTEATGGISDTSMRDELRGLLNRCGAHRIVFDPIGPLLVGTDPDVVSARFRQVVNSAAGTGATVLYLLDTPIAESYLDAARASVHGVLSWEASEAHGVSMLRCERMPGIIDQPGIRIDILPGIGLRESFEANNGGWNRGAEAVRTSRFNNPSAGEPGALPGVLIIEPDATMRAALRGLLEGRYQVYEAQGAADGLSMVGTHSPALACISQTSKGAPGTSIVRKLRQTGRNLPIILMAGGVRRAADVAATLDAGVDVILDRPVDGRILTLTVDNLLRRTGALSGTVRAEDELVLPPPPPRGDVSCTTSLDFFLDRFAREVRWCAEYGVTPTLSTLRLPPGEAPVHELASAAAMVSRAEDLVYMGVNGIAVLMPDTTSEGPLLNRVLQSWAPQVAPSLETFTLGSREDAVDRAAAFIVQKVGGETSHAASSAELNRLNARLTQSDNARLASAS